MRSLRTYLERLRKTAPDQLVTVREPVDWRYEVTAHVAGMEKRVHNPALLFENVKDHSIPLLINLFGNVDRISLALGGKSHVSGGRLEFYEEWNRLFARDIAPVLVDDGPVKDIRLRGADVDLTSLPIPRFYEQDGGRYVTAGLVAARNPDVPEALMGHQQGLVAVYARYDQAEKILEEVYLKAERNLSLYEHSTTMLELKEKMETQDRYLDDLIKKLYRDNSRLEGDLQSLNSKLALITEKYEGKTALENDYIERIEKLESDVDRSQFLYEMVHEGMEQFSNENKDLKERLDTMSGVIGNILDRVKKGENIFLDVVKPQG
ncbi:unnamed protein product [marine sediment metagenome]|uniref:UbiD family decarboxylase n=1 Tax=marine sediment metagenome TaxID=412755 RepID=X0RLS9_9ZZZZ